MKWLGMMVAAFGVASLTGCGALAYQGRVNQGFLYADTRANEKVTDNAVGSKTGEACSTSILGLFTTGDASVAAAVAAGKLTKVGSVDNKYNNIVGVFTTYCVEVSGE